MNHAPKFAYVVLATAILSLVLAGLIAWEVKHTSDADERRDDSAARAEERRDCARSIAARDDSRAMWLYLVDTNKGADPKRVDAFVTELNKRLPVLECDGGDPVPRTP